MTSDGDLLTTVVTIGVLGFVGTRLAMGLRVSARREGRSLVAEIWRGVCWRHVWPVPFVIALIVAAASVLLMVPGLDWGWWAALGGQGNPVSGSTDQTVGTVWEWVIPLVFVAMLLPALPLFAHAEERMFRTGAQRWSTPERALACLKFGLVHALIGIPIGAALALSLGGAYFMSVYLRAYRRGDNERVATLESTRAHSVYNLWIMALIATYAVLVAVGA